MKGDGDGGRRFIPPGSCTWCRHKPHDVACKVSIRTGRNESETCPCTRHEWVQGRLTG